MQKSSALQNDDGVVKKKPQRKSRGRRDVTWRIVVAYRGEGFVGWQRQPGERAVQSELEEAFQKIVGHEVFVRGAGRTDRGVHAQAQVASLRINCAIESYQIIRAMSSLLDDDIAVISADEVPHGFSAKRHSVGKRYCYRIYQGPARDPFLAEQHLHSRGFLDVDAMQKAAAHLVGDHDYESFRSVHCDAVHARRYLWKIDVREIGRVVEIEIRGNAFCRYMIRIIAGTLLGVGHKRFAPDDVKDMLSRKDRSSAGITAAAVGLTLEEVYYPDGLDKAGIPPDAFFPGYPVTDDTWPPQEKKGEGIDTKKNQAVD
ncbi:MAG: tRNA pseudouridine(38-40) synthase TruA [Deltaproteobacteria bacterium]|nr:tRNA pseudouridine(38-40) synthase TruA [Deltaproteobacteria bacterium]